LANDKRIVIEETDEFDPFRERTIVILKGDGSLSISYEYQRAGEDFWRTWQNQGATLGPTALTRLKEALEEHAPRRQGREGAKFQQGG